MVPFGADDLVGVVMYGDKVRVGVVVVRCCSGGGCIGEVGASVAEHRVHLLLRCVMLVPVFACPSLPLRV